MAPSTRFVLVLPLAGLLVSGVSAAPGPTLRTAAPAQRHIVVTFVPGDLAPAEIAVATRPARVADGRFVRANVRLLERISANAGPAGAVRFRTAGTVSPGTYYVAVSGILQDPPVSCGPVRWHCAERWSNVLRVVVPHRA